MSVTMEWIHNKKVLVSAGPTYEKIDDVRFIGNFSSGKMGFALAETANKYNAKTTLVTGPTALTCSNEINRIDIQSAEQMYNAIIPIANNFDIIIMAAAVSDYKPTKIHKGKIKKSSDKMTIELTKTKDILKSLGTQKPVNQILVGFALESENMLEYAKGKLGSKNCDIIIANKANKEKSGFSGDENTITIIDKNDNIIEYKPMPKTEVAKQILIYCGKYLQQRHNRS